MQNIHHLIIDTISQYELSINELLYGNKINFYPVLCLQAYNIKQIQLAIWELLQHSLIYLTDDEYQETEFFTQDFNYSTFIGLTALGGEYWEKLYQPNWDNYIQIHYDDKSYLEPVKLELISLNIMLLNNATQHLSSDKLQLTNIKSWNISYWKSITNQKIYQMKYVAETIQEKILIDDIYNNISSYQQDFCKNTEYFF